MWRTLAIPFLFLTAIGPALAQGTVDCNADFIKLRTDLEVKGKALQDAGKRKASPVELCPMFRRYSDAEIKVVRFLEQNQSWCRVPDEAVKNAKATQIKTIEIRNKVCAAAAGPPPPPPSLGLSGALSQPTGPTAAPGTGTGVFDTLTGNVLQR